MTKKLALVLAAAFAACTGAGSGDVRYSGGAGLDTPELVMIDEGVQVVVDADEPTFYTDNSYWLYRDNGWYRSPRYRGGWTRVEAPPERLRRINQPIAYAHYHRERGPQTTYNETTNRDEYNRVPRPRDPQPRHQWRDEPQPYANPLPPYQQPPMLPVPRDDDGHDAHGRDPDR